MITKEFITAGRAVFTVELPGGDHYTYRISKHREEPKWFVGLLTGPDNTRDYSYMGFLDVARGLVLSTSGSKIKGDAFPYRLLRRVITAVWEGRQDQITRAGYDLHHEGRCGRCGRVLTVPESIKNGIGPECAAQMAGV